MMKNKVIIEEAIETLKKQHNKTFAVMMKHGSMSVEYFAPKNIDTQQAHNQDEVYVIVSGSSEFYRNGEIINCKKNDVIFVPADMNHHFLNFTKDFATWVIFYGPVGGESTQ